VPPADTPRIIGSGRMFADVPGKAVRPFAVALTAHLLASLRGADWRLWRPCRDFPNTTCAAHGMEASISVHLTLSLL